MNKVVLLCFIGLALCADSVSLSESSTSSFSNSFEANSKSKYKSNSDDKEIRFSLSKNEELRGSWYLKNKKEICEFIDMPLERKGNTYIFQDHESKCRFVVKIDQKSITATSNGQSCVDAEYCQKR